MSLYYKQKLISGVRDVPSMTLAQYNALTNKPKLWIRTDAPESDRGINADDIQYEGNISVSDMLTPQAITVTPNSTYVNTTSGNYVMAVHQIGKLVVVNIGLVKYKADVPNANNPMFTGLPPAKEIVEPVFSSNYRMRIEKGEGILRDWYNNDINTNFQFWGSFSYICE